MDFKTIDGAMEIFKSLNCIGNENCIFVTFKEDVVHSTSSLFYNKSIIFS